MSSLGDITVLKYVQPAISLNKSVKVELKKLLAELYSIGGDWTQVKQGLYCSSQLGVLFGTARPSLACSQFGMLGAARTGSQLGGIFGTARPCSQFGMLGTANPGSQLGGNFGAARPGLVLAGSSLQQTLPSKYHGMYVCIKLIQSVLFDSGEIPGLYLFKKALEMVADCLDKIRSQGESSCTNFMPTCQYLKGILVMLLENHAYWEAKIAGEKPDNHVKNMVLPDVGRSGFNLQPQVMPLNQQQVNFTAPQPVAAQPLAPTSSEVIKPEESLAVSITLTDSLHSGLINLWKNKGHADVTLVTKNKQIRAHKIILASRSEHFDQLVFGRMKEHDQDVVEVKDIPNADVFEAILEYAYTGSITITGNIQTMFDAINLAGRFGFQLLKSALEAALIKKVNEKNVLKFLPPADTYGMDALREKCLDQLDEISTTVLGSDEFTSLDPLIVKMVLSRDTFDAPEINIFECLIKIIRNFHMESSEASELLQSCIHLSSMDAKDIYRKVKPTGYFTEMAISESVCTKSLNDLNKLCGRGAKEPNVNLLISAVSTNDQGRKNVSCVSLNMQSPKVKLTLKKPYLANVIKMEVCPTQRMQLSHPTNDSNLPCISENQVDILKASFTLMVSRDKVNWITLANYESYECMGEIKLEFPAQSVRHIKVDLKNNGPFSVRLHECKYKDLKAKPVVGVDGIYAPQQEIEPLACQSVINNTSSEVYRELSRLTSKSNHQADERILVFLCQPYYITDLRFEMAKVSSNIKVFVSQAKSTGYDDVSYTHSRSENSCTYSIKFSPRTVSYIYILIPNGKKVEQKYKHGLSQTNLPVAVAPSTFGLSGIPNLGGLGLTAPHSPHQWQPSPALAAVSQNQMNMDQVITRLYCKYVT